ncbi:MAG: hypothetical protein RBG13Loki_2823 [Promethearchaeota archaeon CR_4]|nr:MAG: hypothetical protein RBG13Loki_2823 [Candidatus Lokiarchaeota archaeon CR_4]
MALLARFLTSLLVYPPTTHRHRYNEDNLEEEDELLTVFGTSTKEELQKIWRY